MPVTLSPKAVDITPELPEHFGEVRKIVASAFEGSEFGHHGEAELVESLRTTEECISLVALVGNKIVGQIIFTRAEIRLKDDVLIGMALGPMAVTPESQNLGIGTKLVEAGLSSVFEHARKFHFVVVVGHPEFYPRFGFVSATEISLAHGFEGLPQELLFVKPKTAQRLSQLSNGNVYFDPAFGPQFPNNIQS